MSSIHSADVQWQLIRNSHSFLVKRDGITLSGEPGNLTNKHSFKFSGLANNRTVDVSANKAGKIELRTRKCVRSLASTSAQLNKNRRQKRSVGARVVEAATSRAFYRRDLAKFAVARFHALNLAKSVKKNSKKLSKRQSAAVAKRSAKKSSTK